MDSNLNVTTIPEDLIRFFDSAGNAQGRTESVIESEDSEESETGNEETANETEVETTAEAVKPADIQEGEEEDQPPIKIDHGIQATVEKRNAKTETSHSFVCSSDMPLMTRGIPIFINCIKNAFMDGGYDPRAWDQGTLDSTPVANFGDVLYIQVLHLCINLTVICLII